MLRFGSDEAIVFVTLQYIGTQWPTGSKTVSSGAKYNLNVTSPTGFTHYMVARYSLSVEGDKGNYSTKNPASHFRVAIWATMIDLYRVSAAEAIISSF